MRHSLSVVASYKLNKSVGIIVVAVLGAPPPTATASRVSPLTTSLDILADTSPILALFRIVVAFLRDPFGAVGGSGDSLTPTTATSSHTGDLDTSGNNNDYDTMATINQNITEEDENPGFFAAHAVTPFPYNADEYSTPAFAIVLTVLAALAIIANLSLFGYIIINKLYKNFVSSHFIAHLCLTNVGGLLVTTPMLAYSFWTGNNPWAENNGMCRIQAFLLCSIWSVVHYMVLCIAGVHILTFARIHYDQLFGLKAIKLCGLSWLVAFAIALPCITNGHIVIYDPVLRTCVWGSSDSSYKFLTYFFILGVLIPMGFMYYSYFRVLKILYHSPIVFQSMGLYSSRFLVYAFLLGPLYQLPFYGISVVGSKHFGGDSFIPVAATTLCFTQLFVSPILYGVSLVKMKEEDIALTERATKSTQGANANSYHPIQHGFNL
uniref:G_PROTEIN_RECEP_F1_2 domain-containing protein n=1 Tax=Panagrellus redivivus TaxID=6233 RepID=A0A7E4V3M3_PANRE